MLSVKSSSACSRDPGEDALQTSVPLPVSELSFEVPSWLAPAAVFWLVSVVVGVADVLLVGLSSAGMTGPLCAFAALPPAAGCFSMCPW